MSNTLGRSQWVDAVRGLAMLCMVYGHCVLFGQGAAFYQANGYYYDPICKAIYSFHMPILMMLSGFFYKKTADRLHGWHLIANRAQSLLPHVLIYALISLPL